MNDRLTTAGEAITASLTALGPRQLERLETMEPSGPPIGDLTAALKEMLPARETIAEMQVSITRAVEQNELTAQLSQERQDALISDSCAAMLADALSDSQGARAARLRARYRHALHGQPNDERT